MSIRLNFYLSKMNSKLMTLKHFNVIALLLFANFSWSQITTDGNIIKQPKKEALPERSLDTINTEFYFQFSPQYTFRTLTPSPAPFGKELGYRDSEYALWSNSLSVGIRNKIHNKFYFDFGLGYSSNKEGNQYKIGDTSYVTTRSYRHFAVPIKFSYITGNDISFYASIGVTPKAFFNALYEEEYTFQNAPRKTEKVEEQGYSSFLIDLTAATGFRLRMSNNFGVFAGVEARRQLNSNYSNQHPYVRKAYALGFNLGIYFPIQ